MNNTSPSKMKHSSSSISNLMKGLDVVVMLFEQVKCEVIENASQAASHGRYGVVFFGPHCIWLDKYSFSEVFIQ